MYTIFPEGPQHGPAIDALHDFCFGPGRFARTAYRIREGAADAPELSFVACDGEGRLLGSIRYTPILIGETPALMLGPLAVDSTLRGKGVGLELMQVSLQRALSLGHRLVILIGDEPYYARVGFARVPDGRLSLPGPYDPNRLLYKELAPLAFEGVSGDLIGRPADGGWSDADTAMPPVRTAGTHGY